MAADGAIIRSMVTAVEIMTLAEAARLAGLSRQGLAKHVAAGNLKPYRARRPILFLGAEVRRFAAMPRPKGRPPLKDRRKK
jgi:hypothetical protein